MSQQCVHDAKWAADCISCRTRLAEQRAATLEIQVAVLTKELGDLLKAKAFSVRIPSNTMEQEFGRHYTRGWEVGVRLESERRKKLIGLLRETTAYELGESLRFDIDAAIVDAEKLECAK